MLSLNLHQEMQLLSAHVIAELNVIDFSHKIVTSHINHRVGRLYNYAPDNYIHVINYNYKTPNR